MSRGGGEEEKEEGVRKGVRGRGGEELEEQEKVEELFEEEVELGKGGS